MRRATTSAIALALCAAWASATASADEPPLFNEDQEKLVSKDPAFVIARPNKEWLFIDLARAKKSAAKARGADVAEEEYKTLKARLYHGGHPADLFVNVFDEPRADATSESVGLEWLERTKAVLGGKGCKVTAQGPTTLSKLKAFAFEAEGTVAGKPLAVSKLIVYREADKRVFVISLECPKEKAKNARKDLPKLLKGIQLS